MNENRIEIVAPTSRAFERMKNILFRPFDIGKWFVLGFSAWLATLLEGGGSTGGGGGGGTDTGSGESFDDFVESAQQWIVENLALIVTVAAFVLLVVLVVLLVLTWVQSRGKFLFLDNVVNNRALVSQPWKEYRAEGNSLFRWMIVYGLLVTALIVAVLAGFVAVLWPMAREEAFDPAAWPVLAGLGVAFFLIVLAAAYVGFLLENAVIPVMYRDRVATTTAWKKVLSLHSRAGFRFVLLFLWLIPLSLAAGVAILALVLGTCCVAGLVLMIPYLGAVLLLPMTVFFRALGPEFLRQFGHEFDIFAPEASDPPLLPS